MDTWFNAGLFREMPNIIASVEERHVAKRTLKENSAHGTCRCPLPKRFPKWLDVLGKCGFAKQRKGVEEMLGEIRENDDPIS
jgi:hypothetical protein